MPGRLLMDQQGATGPQDLKKDRSQAQDGHTSLKRDFAQMQQSNGAKDNASNGSHPHNGAPMQTPKTNGQTVALHPAPADLPPPPELDQSWQSSDANKSMGLMIDRLAQQCFGDLNETLTKMSELPASTAGQANGVIPHTVDKSEPSLTRKRTLMDFANNQRDRFIKTLILSDWARNAHDMAKLVDIKVWQEKQFNSQLSAMQFIGITKHDVARAKMPNPNIEGAMEVLATGKGIKWPDMGYIPPKKLTAKQLLRTLRSMNVSLATRLNLHEDLPPNLKQFTIQNGRASFRVPGEFDVDVSIADEDPSTPFYFIDVKFLFTPTPSLSDDGLRNVLEARTNEALASKGLQGCYDFLHNFVLTHKVNVLRQQAVQLHRDKWFDCIQIQTSRRVLTVQYWKGLPGPKSWIEFGISTGKSKDKPSQRLPTSRHSVRWFRRKQEVQNDRLEIDWTDLSFGDILATVAAKHASWTLRTIQERLQQLAGASSKLQTQLRTSETQPQECSLTLSLSGLRAPIAVRVEPLTGHISVSPSTRSAAHIERYLNSEYDPDHAKSLAELLCRSVEERLTQAAHLARWVPVDKSTIGNQPNLKALFGENVIRRNLYRCNKGWAEQWALYITYSLSGEKWWLVQLDNRSEQGRQVRFVANRWALSETLPLAEEATISRASMLRVERAAEAEVSFAVLSQQLLAANIPHRTERLSSLTESESTVDSLTSDLAVYLRLPQKGHKNAAQKGSHDVLAMADWIRIAPQECIRTDDHLMEMRHEIRLTVDSGKLRSLHAHLNSTKSRDADIAMNGSGALALTMRAEFGQPFLDDICRLLQRCMNLDNALKVSKSLQLQSKTLSLSRFAFTYGSAQQFAALLSFGNKSSVAQLKLEPTNSNPHKRIRTVLEKLFNTQENGFFALAFSMNMTLPLLQAFEAIESLDDNRASLIIHAHSPTQYSISYKAPLPPCRFSIRAFWHDQDRAIAQREYFYQLSLDEAASSGLPAGTKDNLIQLSRSHEGPGWFGNQKGGFVSNASSIDEALQKWIHTIQNSSDNNSASIKKQETPGVEVKTEPQNTHQLQKSQSGQQQKQQTQGARPLQNGQQDPSQVKKEVIELD